MFDTPGHLETIEKRIEMRIRAEMLGPWEELWRAIKKMEPGLGDANKPLAIAASYALLVKERDDLKQHLIRHQAEVFRLSDLLRKANPKWGSGMHLNTDEPRLTHKTRDGDVVSGETNE